MPGIPYPLSDTVTCLSQSWRFFQLVRPVHQNLLPSSLHPWNLCQPPNNKKGKRLCGFEVVVFLVRCVKLPCLDMSDRSETSRLRMGVASSSLYHVAADSPTGWIDLYGVHIPLRTQKWILAHITSPLRHSSRVVKPITLQYINVNVIFSTYFYVGNSKIESYLPFWTLLYRGAQLRSTKNMSHLNRYKPSRKDCDDSRVPPRTPNENEFPLDVQSKLKERFDSLVW